MVETLLLLALVYQIGSKRCLFDAGLCYSLRLPAEQSYNEEHGGLRRRLCEVMPAYPPSNVLM